jgi:predicted ribonuclease YlaK
MVGTRIGDGSSVVFTGDYKQSEARYRADNGLSLFIEKCKGNPLVGIIILEEDVRSEASKVFADL